jgi:hypothetical protein
MFCATIVLCFSAHQLDVAKEQLFIEWTTSSSIPNVTFGLPTEHEVDAVANFIDEIRKTIISSTAGELTTSQRELDVPFLLAMLDGVTMEYAKGYAEQCLAHLAHVQGDVFGIAASRMWRMRLRASQILGDALGAQEAAHSLRSLRTAHGEDRIIVSLYDIQRAFEEGNVKLARTLYDRQDALLSKPKSQYLRVPFAHGYARLSPTTAEALYGWFSLADWLTDYGYNQKIIDAELCRWIERLPTSPLISEQSEDPRIASLAMRIEISKTLLDNTEVALEKLMILARAGDGRAAERVLEQGDSKHTEEAIKLVFAYPKRVQASLDYWQLYASRIDLQHRNYVAALQRLEPIASGKGEYQISARALIDTIRGYESHTLREALSVSEEGLPNALLNGTPLHVVHDLLQQCIHVCHATSIDEWHHHALKLLLRHSDGISPSVVAEGHRLLGQFAQATPLFLQAIERDGPSIQTTAGLADCTQDSEAMRRVVNSTSPSDASAYWYWVSNLRLLQWFIEDGGDQTQVIAKVNRLRQKDASLGGAQFMSQFNLLSR